VIPKHGTRTCYRRGCRHPDCVRANLIYNRDYREIHRPRTDVSDLIDIIAEVLAR
jgi:hypothetical protein